jgi:hypothetical protein
MLNRVQDGQILLFTLVCISLSAVLAFEFVLPSVAGTVFQPGRNFTIQWEGASGSLNLSLVDPTESTNYGTFECMSQI